MKWSNCLGTLATLWIATGAMGAAQSGSPGTDYKAPDGSLTLRLPQGWRAAPTVSNGVTIYILQPSDGGEDRILVAAGPASKNTIRELADETVRVVTQQLLPGSRATSAPKFVDTSAGPTAELSYELPGQSVWWQAVVLLKDNRYITALGGARRDRSALIQQLSRAVFGSVRLVPVNQASSPASTGQLAQLIVGHWTWYHKTDSAGGRIAASTSREIWFYANGRYQYTSVTYVPNMPPGIDPTTTVSGTYQIQGNKIIARADNGQSQTFTVEIVEGGKGLKLDGELYIRD
jgi:lipocalin-like protein